MLYEVITALNQALHGEMPWLLLLGIGFLKIVATPFSLGPGGSGGALAPPPASSSCTGKTLRTRRKAWITPIGSLNRSNREIWTRRGCSRPIVITSYSIHYTKLYDGSGG